MGFLPSDTSSVESSDAWRGGVRLSPLTSPLPRIKGRDFPGHYQNPLISVALRGVPIALSLRQSLSSLLTLLCATGGREPITRTRR